jgi:hypothetical protein
MLITLFALSIPIVAIVGGIAAQIVRTQSQQKIAELAMKERIAAIEKGLDPADLPPVPSLSASGELLGPMTPRGRALRTSLGLAIAAAITVASGLAVIVLLLAFPQSQAFWQVGLVPVLVGAGLGAASWLVRRNAPPEPPAAPAHRP